MDIHQFRRRVCEIDKLTIEIEKCFVYNVFIVGSTPLMTNGG